MKPLRFTAQVLKTEYSSKPNHLKNRAAHATNYCLLKEQVASYIGFIC